MVLAGLLNQSGSHPDPTEMADYVSVLECALSSTACLPFANDVALLCVKFSGIYSSSGEFFNAFREPVTRFIKNALSNSDESLIASLIKNISTVEFLNRHYLLLSEFFDFLAGQIQSPDHLIGARVSIASFLGDLLDSDPFPIPEESLFSLLSVGCGLVSVDCENTLLLSDLFTPCVSRTANIDDVISATMSLFDPNPLAALVLIDSLLSRSISADLFPIFRFCVDAMSSPCPIIAHTAANRLEEKSHRFSSLFQEHCVGLVDFIISQSERFLSLLLTVVAELTDADPVLPAIIAYCQQLQSSRHWCFVPRVLNLVVTRANCENCCGDITVLLNLEHPDSLDCAVSLAAVCPDQMHDTLSVLTDACLRLLSSEDSWEQAEGIDALGKLFSVYTADMVEFAADVLPQIISACNAPYQQQLASSDFTEREELLAKLRTFVPSCLRLIRLLMHLYPHLFQNQSLTEQFSEVICQFIVPIEDCCVCEAGNLLSAFVRACQPNFAGQFRTFPNLIFDTLYKNVSNDAAVALGRALTAILQVHGLPSDFDPAHILYVCAGVMKKYGCRVHEVFASILANCQVIHPLAKQFYERGDPEHRGIALAVFGAIIARTDKCFSRENVEQLAIAAACEIAGDCPESIENSAAFLCSFTANYPDVLAGIAGQLMPIVKARMQELPIPIVRETLVALFCVFGIGFEEVVQDEEAVESAISIVPLTEHTELNSYVYGMLVRRIEFFENSRLFLRIYRLFGLILELPMIVLIQLGILPSLLDEIEEIVAHYQV
jgi:hypothetical protein